MPYLVENNQFKDSFIYDETLPRSIDFIERYENLWDWSLLAGNNVVISNGTIRNYFHDQLSPYFENNLEAALNRSMGLNGSEETFAEEIEVNDHFFRTHRELQFQHSDEIEKATSIDWRILSRNTLLPWSQEIIERHIHRWNWPELCINESIKWDYKLMKHFEHNIDWHLPFVDNETEFITNDLIGINSNLHIEWDIEMLSEFSHRLDPFNTTMSRKTNWNFELLVKFYEFWDPDCLPGNKRLWDTVFHEFQKDQELFQLLDVVLEKKSRQFSEII